MVWGLKSDLTGLILDRAHARECQFCQFWPKMAKNDQNWPKNTDFTPKIGIFWRQKGVKIGPFRVRNGHFSGHPQSRIRLQSLYPLLRGPRDTLYPTRIQGLTDPGTGSDLGSEVPKSPQWPKWPFWGSFGSDTGLVLGLGRGSRVPMGLLPRYAFLKARPLSRSGQGSHPGGDFWPSPAQKWPQKWPKISPFYAKNGHF